jgi:predicted Zn-ribbon and HTH transcriptional regulator
VPIHEENIRRILGEAKEPLFASEIAEHLNSELRPDSAYSTVEVAKFMKSMSEQVAQLLDGRWMLKRLML